VSGWIEPVFGETPEDESAKLTLRNASDEPVYRIRVEHEAWWAEEFGLPILKPGEVVEAPAVAELAQVDSPDVITPLRITFIDAGGRRWRRTTEGRLRRVRRDRRIRKDAPDDEALPSTTETGTETGDA
jgi:hypothetical protein